MRSRIIVLRDHGKLLNYSCLPRYSKTHHCRFIEQPRQQSQFQIEWSLRRSILTSSVQSRLVTLIERHEKILDEMNSSGHTNSNVGKELTLLAPIASLNRTLRQLNEEHCSLIELLNEATDTTTTSDDDFESECKIELEHVEKKRNKIEQKIIDAVLPKDEDDYESDAIIEIRAGTGGDEASLFAGELLDCYIRTSKELKWKVEELAKSRTDLGGVREATISISGGANFQQPLLGDDDNNDDDNQLIGPYGFFKFESGVHRVQRIPINDTKIQTSACSVAVLPLITNNSSNDTSLLPMSELRIETMRASGAGGQHINTTDSAVRITHIPTGITASIQDGRSQHQNKEQAMKLVTARVNDMKREEEAKKLGERRSSLMGGGDRSERIRTYNYPQDRITDHRCKQSLYGIDTILNGSGNNASDGIVVSFMPHLKSIYREELLNQLEDEEERARNKNKNEKKK